MKALILAAGLGTRLSPLTDVKPKSMVEVNGVPIILKQISNLIKYNVNDITVVAGYKSEILIETLNKIYPEVNIIVNNEFKTTNNMFSAYLARNFFEGHQFLLLNGDVYFDDVIIKELTKDVYENAIVVEEGIYIEESMKVTYNNSQINEISKEIGIKEAYGTSIDIYKFSAKASTIFFKEISEVIIEKGIVNQWTEVGLNQILGKIQFKPCPLTGKWMEIDNHDDLKKAELLFL